MSDYETTFDLEPLDSSGLPKAPIFLVAYFAVYEPLREWCETSDIRSFHSTHDGNYLLTIAVKSKCEPLCAALIAKGRSSDEGLQLCLSQALVAAADQGDSAMVKYLIGEGANASLSPEPIGTLGHYSGPVDPAARRGNLALVRYLVEEANAGIGDALSRAACPESSGNGLDVIRSLIEDYKADPNLPTKRHQYSSALIAAVSFHRHDMIRYYLEEASVDVNVVYSTGWYGSPLSAVITTGSLEDVRYFVEEGKADVNLLHEVAGFGSALADAASDGKLEIVKYLVEEAGAKPDLQLKAGPFGSALTAAIASAKAHRIETVKYLASHAEVNLTLLCGRYGSALAAALDTSKPGSKVNMDVVRLLIQAGADVNMQHQVGEYGSPFVTAAFFVEDLDIIHYLVDKCEADIHALHSTGRYESALAAAANSGNLETIRYPVDSGVDADCELRFGAYSSAIVAAADRQSLNPAIIKYLVDMGVDTNREFQIGVYGSALVAAVATGQSSLAAVKYLVEKGKANVDFVPTSGRFGSALLAAIISPFDFQIDQRVIEEICDPRMDIDLATQILGDDLTKVVLSATFAQFWWRKDAPGTVEYLVGAGANVNLELKVCAYGNALAAAAAIGKLDLVKYLVRRGSANANIPLNTGSFGSVLVVAIIAYSKLRSLHPDSIENIQNIILGQIHHLALRVPPYYCPTDHRLTAWAQSMVESTMSSLIDIMIYLLKSGADANLQLNVGPFRSALVAAAATGCFWHVKYLVENAQADVSLQLQSGPYANAYEAAVAHEHHDIAEYLARNAGGHCATSSPSSQFSLSANPHDEGQQEREKAL